MTTKLYLDDCYLTKTTAKVLGCEAIEGGFEVELDRTILFPTGGGQPHDTGLIGSANVLDVREDGEKVIHVTDAALPVGETVTVSLHWPRRFDHMQQHSGEHILSYAAYELFGAHNVGFHMAETYATIDLDSLLDGGQVASLERRTMEFITSNLPVRVVYVSPEELSGMQLRKQAEGIAGEIRIVTMPGADSCTCCGTHVRNLGEVGFVKIESFEKYKGGTRLTFHCGARALDFAGRMQSAAERAAKLLSVKPELLGEAVVKQQKEQANLRRENKELYHKLTGYLGEELLDGANCVKGTAICVRLYPDLPSAQLKPLAQRVCKGRNALCLLLSEAEGALQYVLCCSEKLGLDMGELCQAVNAALNGRGGGRGTLAQGSAKAFQGQEQAVEQLARYLEQRLKGMK